jgi:hypothetical protein
MPGSAVSEAVGHNLYKRVAFSYLLFISLAAISLRRRRLPGTWFLGFLKATGGPILGAATLGG